MNNLSLLPQHIAIIMDGNRRWAKSQGLAAVGGHNYVVDQVIEPLIERCGELNISYLTLWAFSTENWGRDADEVHGIMELFKRALMEKVERFIKKGARLHMIGDLSKFSPELQAGMQRAMKASEKNKKITITFALNYGGRDEIVRGINRVLASRANQVTTEEFSNYLDTAGMPDPDLIIRTGGDQRLSGFLAWQAVYSELYFTHTLMPDFTVSEFEKALAEYQLRQRRFGK